MDVAVDNSDFGLGRSTPTQADNCRYDGFLVRVPLHV
jgi:hypothetical protein